MFNGILNLQDFYLDEDPMQVVPASAPAPALVHPMLEDPSKTAALQGLPTGVPESVKSSPLARLSPEQRAEYDRAPAGERSALVGSLTPDETSSAPPPDNSLTIKDYAALASAAGILGAMFMPKPKAPPRAGGPTRSSAGNPYLKRYV